MARRRGKAASIVESTDIVEVAARILGLYRRRLRAHEMLPGDELDLADILEWVEEYVIAPDPLMTHDDVKDN